MVAKFGAKRWEEMKKEHEERKNEEMVVITGTDLLNHSVTNYIISGKSYKKVIWLTRRRNGQIAPEPIQAPSMGLFNIYTIPF